MTRIISRKRGISICIRILIGFIVGIIIGIVFIPGYEYLRYYYKEMPKKPIRQQLYSELKTVALENCTLKRFGDAHDGGYLLCENLMKNVTSAYSYGIEGRDKWGCDVSTEFNLVVHQYDCFDTRRTVCEEGDFVFHEECVGDKYSISENKTFDSLKNQIIRNKDEKKNLIVKMDVEGSEWDTFLATPDDVLNNIDQLIVEFHGADQEKHIEVIKKIKNIFHLINIHYNNCNPNRAHPFPSMVYEVLFVNKRIGKLDDNGIVPHKVGLDSPNCQNHDFQSTLTIKDFYYITLNNVINYIQ